MSRQNYRNGEHSVNCYLGVRISVGALGSEGSWYDIKDVKKLCKMELISNLTLSVSISWLWYGLFVRYLKLDKGDVNSVYELNVCVHYPSNLYVETLTPMWWYWGEALGGNRIRSWGWGPSEWG